VRAARFWWQFRNFIGVALITLVFMISRGVYYAKGVRFDVSSIDYFAQLLDRVLLRTRLVESLCYLHSQPPLYNLVTGVALKLAPNRPEMLLWPLFMAAGLYTALCLNFIMLALRVPWLVAAALATGMATSPGFVLYENWYFYPHLDVAWLLGALAWFSHSGGCPGRSLFIAALHLACLSLTRSLFHPLFYALAAIVAIVLAAPGVRGRTFACFAIPGLLLLLWCGKNLLLFGFFGTSSWASRNISQSVTLLLGSERVEGEARLGHLSAAAALRPFDTADHQIEAFGLQEHKTGVPALDNTQKANDSVLTTNYNHWSYPPSARFYAADARHLLAQFPTVYLKGIAERSVSLFFSPIEDGFVALNRARIAKAAQRFDDFDQSRRVRWLLGVGVALTVLGAPWAEAARRRSLAVCFLAICWGLLAGIFGDYGENYRFRYDVLWLAWVVAVSGYFSATRGTMLAFQETRRAFRRAFR
jgi:hypothetical protein